MRIKFLIILVLLFYIEGNTQNRNKIYIEYEVKRGEIFSNEYLIASSDKALYTTDQIDFVNKSSNFKNDKSNNLNLKEKRIKINQMKFYSSLNSRIIYLISKPQNGKDVTVAKDSLKSIKWDLSSKEKKKINNFECYKATGNFRGSKIVVYYTPKIPISFGPYKFKGLPGLILEAYNIDAYGLKYNWKAKNITYPFKTDVNINFSKNLYDVPIISYRSMIEEFENKMKISFQKVKASLPRGSSISLDKRQRTSIEKKYEWEKNQKDK